MGEHDMMGKGGRYVPNSLDPPRNVVIEAQWWRGSWWGGQAGGVCEGVVLVGSDNIKCFSIHPIHP